MGVRLHVHACVCVCVCMHLYVYVCLCVLCIRVRVYMVNHMIHHHFHLFVSNFKYSLKFMNFGLR